MKPQVKKIFDGCNLCKRCELCPNFEFCSTKKKRAISRKRRRKLSEIIFMAQIILILLIAVLGGSLLILSIYDKPESVNEPEELTTIQSQEEVPSIPKAELSAEGPSEIYYYEISEEEKIMMAKLVWAEARGECYEGKAAVAAVVLNRFRFEENNWDFENESISSLILQERQFAGISNVTMQDLEEYPDCMKAVEDACKGWDPTRAIFEDGALYFYNPYRVTGTQKEIRDGIKFMAIGNHNFHYDFEKEVKG